MSEVGVRRVWIVVLSFLAWLLLLVWGVVAIANGLSKLPPLWPSLHSATIVKPERGSILAADGTPLAVSLPNGARAYPKGSFAGQVIGYTELVTNAQTSVSRAGRGLGGVEYAENRQLAAGRDIRLTLNPTVQAIAQQALQKSMKMSNAAWGTAIVMDTKTGRLLALANAPTFNPAGPRGVPSRDPRMVDDALGRLVEPGSTLKLISAAVLMQEGLATLATKVKAPMQRVVQQFTIHDVVPHPKVLTMAQVLEYSSNVGMSTLIQRTTPEVLYSFYKKIHLDDPDILPGIYVDSPIIRPPQDWSAIRFANAAFGQGLSITPLHLAVAFNTIGNNGTYVPPSLIYPVNPPKTVRVFSPKVASRLRYALTKYASVEARVPGYPVGGKTGTAQVVVNGRYSNSVYIALYGGWVPSDHPRVTILVALFDPKGRLIQGAQVAAPVFKQVAEGLLSLWGILPQRNVLSYWGNGAQSPYR